MALPLYQVPGLLFDNVRFAGRACCLEVSRITFLHTGRKGLPLLRFSIFHGGNDQAVLTLEPFPLDEPVFVDGNIFLAQEGVEVLFISDSTEIDGGEVLELRLYELDNPSLLAEHGLEEEDLSIRLEPISDPVEDQFLIFKQHEAHAEEDEIEIVICRGLVVLYGLVEDPDVIVEPTLADEGAAVIEVAFVDVYPDDLEVLLFDKGMIVLDHDTIADPHIQDPRIEWEVLKAIIVAEICHIIDDQLVEVVFHIFHKRLSCS
jgi:hypothetical protein